MGLTPPTATTKASTDTYCGSEAAYPIAASYLEMSILSLTAPILKKTNKTQHAGNTTPNTHTHARVGSTYTPSTCKPTSLMFAAGKPVSMDAAFPELMLFQPGSLTCSHLSLKALHNTLESDDPVIVVLHSGASDSATHTAQLDMPAHVKDMPTNLCPCACSQAVRTITHTRCAPTTCHTK